MIKKVTNEYIIKRPETPSLYEMQKKKKHSTELLILIGK